MSAISLVVITRNRKLSPNTNAEAQDRHTEQSPGSGVALVGEDAASSL